MGNPTILLTGGTGKTGRRIASQLKAEGRCGLVASRSGSSVYGHPGVCFDWYNKTNHADILEGIQAIYLVAPSHEIDSLKVMQPFIDLALDRGIRRFVLLSASLLEEGGPMMGAAHAYLKQHAPEWTVLRPTRFMQNFSEEFHMSSILDEGRIYSATFFGKVPFVDTYDIALVANAALTNPTPLNRDVIITGPEALSYAEVAQIIGGAIGHPVSHIRLSEDDFSQRLINLGMNENYAKALAMLDTLVARGYKVEITDEVEKITGKTPKSLDTFAREMRKIWLPD
ncbi:ergot alkaloid biosynthesis protein [Budvicia diplopodorum]|uniref:ergot alkaloid biosynthesis protein n=1 Tax=Budvicia diplopodorum TaxID=1119056 RepID=UPI00135A2ED4|nr:ergot alkaloid biosynthesis protein [Budvicia diplopodorum]